MKIFGLLNRRKLVLCLLLWAFPSDFAAASEGRKEISDNEGGMKMFADTVGLKEQDKPESCEKKESRATVTLPRKEVRKLLRHPDKFTYWLQGFEACEEMFDPMSEPLEAKSLKTTNWEVKYWKDKSLEKNWEAKYWKSKGLEKNWEAKDWEAKYLEAKKSQGELIVILIYIIVIGVVCVAAMAARLNLN